MKRRTVVFLVTACTVLAGCTGNFTPIPSPIPSPIPICVNDTWSYAENFQTKIKIDSKLKITLEKLAPSLREKEASIRSVITVFGDGEVTLRETTSFTEKGKPEQIIEKQTQLKKDQLQKIVAALEQANVFAIQWGCRESIVAGERVREGIACPCMEELNISVEEENKVHEINDHGACVAAPFDQYCGLWDRIIPIIVEFK